MASTHILTVNSQTFNVHLNYMFAGTGKDGAEHQPGALADILGIRPRDNILFYVMGYGFYGFFVAKSAGERLVFYESPEGQYLDDELGRKTLTYRFFIEPSPYGVYKYGVSEWDAIENPRNVAKQSVLNMQWTWIFKKSKAGRGCVAIPAEEFLLLMSIIKNGNEGVPYSKQYSFSDGEISPEKQPHEYLGETSRAPLLHSNWGKIAREEDLRIFFSADAGLDAILNGVLKPREHGSISYIANEVKCSFGMRSIDLLFLTDLKKCLLVELKNKFVCAKSMLDQMTGYARWIGSYKPYLQEIVPILVLRSPKLYPAGGRGYRFKFLSAQDMKKNRLSRWYRSIVDELDALRQEVGRAKIPKLAELEVYTFNVNEKGMLQSFAPLEQKR